VEFEFEDDFASPELFNINCILGFNIRTTKAYWEKISLIKHPSLNGRLSDVGATLRESEEIRQSKKDETIFLIYRLIAAKRWFCCVVKRLNGEGFLDTAYLTDSIKEGTMIWRK